MRLFPSLRNITTHFKHHKNRPVKTLEPKKKQHKILRNTFCSVCVLDTDKSKYTYDFPKFFYDDKAIFTW